MVLLVPKTPLKVPSALRFTFDHAVPFVLTICALLEPETRRFVVLEAHTAFKSAVLAEV
jgi:hypothetical protein